MLKTKWINKICTYEGCLFKPITLEIYGKNNYSNILYHVS